MQVPREEHSSCTMNKYVYVIGGMDDNYKALSSIEQLRVQCGEDGEILSDYKWRLIQVDGLPPRRNPFVCHMGKDTIAICGGSDFYGRDLGDSYVWNSVTKIIEASSKNN